jgi:hypothetical protein
MPQQLLAFGTLLARSGKVIESNICGTSMGATLPSGSRIRIRPLLAGEYDVGQVVAFVSGGAIFAHRIVYRTQQGVLTRGDTHSLCDFPVPLDAILGAVTEWFIEGKWQGFGDAPTCICERSRSAWAAETLLRTCMRIDIGVARRVSRAFMRLVRVRRRLSAAAFRLRWGSRRETVDVSQR